MTHDITLPATAEPAQTAAANTTPRAPVPLCVDLDGTLVKSDTLVDSVMALLRQRPIDLLKLPAWLMRGKAAFKAEIAKAVALDVEHLPYNRPLLHWLRSEAASGREIFLATGADVRVADRVSAYLGIFDGVFASDGRTNLTGSRKLALLNARFAPTGFEYVGNASPDTVLLEKAQRAWLANPGRSLPGKLRRRGIVVGETFEDRPSTLRTFTKAIRITQWAKNLLVFAPLLLAHGALDHGALDRSRLIATILAFICFSLCASSTYILNDLLDIEADRRHLRKRKRPFAAGDLSAAAGLGIVVAFLAIAGALLHFEPAAFAFFLGTYFLTTLCYSLYLKRIALVDVIILAGLYTLRIVAGGAAGDVPISPWLGAFSLFFFLSLAIVKRYSELHTLQIRGAIPANNRGYLLSDLDQLRSFGTSSGYASVIVFTLYIYNSDAFRLYQHPVRLWLLAPIMVYWISRVWLLAARGQLDDDPVIFAITDKVSLLLGLVMALCVWSAL